MREDHVVHRRGRDRTYDERGGAGNETVKHDYAALLRGAENEAGDRGDFVAPDRGKYSDRIRRIGPVKRKCTSDHRGFMRDASGIEAGAGTRGIGWIESGEGAEQRGGGGRVADSHFAGAD